MNRAHADITSQSKSMTYLMCNKSEVDLILADVSSIPPWLRTKDNKTVDLTDDSKTTCLSDFDRGVLIKGFKKAIHVFQVLEKQVYDDGKTMKDNLKSEFLENMEEATLLINELKKKGFESVKEDDELIEYFSFISLCNAYCVPDLTSPRDVVSIFDSYLNFVRIMSYFFFLKIFKFQHTKVFGTSNNRIGVQVTLFFKKSSLSG